MFISKTNIESIIFDPYKEEGIEDKVRLVIYDEKNRDIFNSIDIPLKERYELFETEVEKHLRYIYKYQIESDGDWEDKTKYKPLRFERVTNKGIKYLLYPEPKSEYLIVGFQGINRNPSYNYVRTLKGAKATQLYIKDDYGKDITKSSYYLGHHNSFKIAKYTLRLIESIRKKFRIPRNKVICIGSSKGGYSSLYFAYKGKYGHVVAGGPQVKLGSYLTKGRDANSLDPKSFMPKILNYLVGEITDEKIRLVDNILFDIIKKSGHDPKVYIHVGRGEPHYLNHVKPLVEFLNNLGLKNMEVDLGDYNDHNELSKYFPPVLKERVNKIIKK